VARALPPCSAAAGTLGTGKDPERPDAAIFRVADTRTDH
jgi:hypothetical protein